MKPLLVLTSSLFVSVALISPAFARPIDFQKFFKPVLPKLKGTKAQVWLPTVIPTQVTMPLFAVGGKESDGGYSVSFAVRPDCDATPCVIGSVYTEKLPNGYSIQQEIAESLDARRRVEVPVQLKNEEPGPIRLTNGIQAYFIPRGPGINCGDSRVLWEQNGYRYTAALKCSTRQDVVKMANSMVKVDPAKSSP